MMTRVKTKREIDAMRQGGHMLASVLQTLREHTKPGITTQALADIAAKELKALGGEPAFLGYQDFPSVLCVSVNDEVVHGIPSNKRIIQNGDIVGLDFGVLYEGMVTDAAISVIAGKPRQKRHLQLLSDTQTALQAGIDAVHHQVRTGDIGQAVEKSLKATARPYGIVRDLVGHGVGHHVHEDPNVPNYGRAGTGPWLEQGMTIAIEPMVTLGSEKVYMADDGWTVCTVDKSWSAHFEHTVLITEKGAEVLTTL